MISRELLLLFIISFFALMIALRLNYKNEKVKRARRVVGYYVYLKQEQNLTTQEARKEVMRQYGVDIEEAQPNQRK